MKKLIRNVANQFGFDITRKARKIVDNSVYDNFPEDSLLKKRFYNIGAGSFEHPHWTNVDYATEHYGEVQKTPFLHYLICKIK